MSPKKCKATSKRTGERCNANAVTGMDVCYHHGGATPKGMASPNFKTGIRSKYLPQQLLNLHNEISQDTQLLSVRDDITLIDTLIAAKLPMLESGESSETWLTVGKLIRDIRKAYKNEDYGKLEDALHELDALADNRRLFYATEQEVVGQLEQRRKLVETEQRILYNETKSLTAEQAMLMVSVLLDAIKKNVRDANALNAIQSEFIRVIGSASQRTISAAADSE